MLLLPLVYIFGSHAQRKNARALNRDRKAERGPGLFAYVFLAMFVLALIVNFPIPALLVGLAVTAGAIVSRTRQGASLEHGGN